MSMPPKVVRRTLDLAGIQVPLIEITGSADGPQLTVLAGVHGCEYASIAGVRSWARALESRELQGRVRAVPVLNMSAFRARTPFVVPEDGKNLNRCFPGHPSGTLAERLAHAAFTQLIAGADAVVDVHAGDMVEALEPFTLYEAGPAEDRALALATAYGLGYVLRQEPGPGRAVSGTTSAAAAQIGVPAITAEAGGCGLVEQAAVDLHVRGLDQVLAELGMAGRPASAEDGAGRDQAAPDLLGRFLWLRCADEGWWEPAVKVGDRVSEGQVLGSVSSIDGARTQEVISAPDDGVLLFMTSSPAVAADGLLLGLGAR
ncbi:MAG TPA: succinylglutamate desuccinylase/aspartoacylase family protein [Streptosporangiaceae bacterium]|nr:succinylglutamate desuccinylase/aspartoacylase family protein [Streptosporangiaceae bacterium]